MAEARSKAQAAVEALQVGGPRGGGVTGKGGAGGDFAWEGWWWYNERGKEQGTSSNRSTAGVFCGRGVSLGLHWRVLLGKGWHLGVGGWGVARGKAQAAVRSGSSAGGSNPRILAWHACMRAAQQQHHQAPNQAVSGDPSVTAIAVAAAASFAATAPPC